MAYLERKRQTGQSVAYYGILNGRVICEASAALDVNIVQNGEGLVDEKCT